MKKQDLQPWPVKQGGPEVFLGYIVALGFAPDLDDAGDNTPYAEFYYAGKVVAYQIPLDGGLFDKLRDYLQSNMFETEVADTYHAKLWVKHEEDGSWDIDLP